MDNHFTFLGYHEYDLVSENGEDGAPPRSRHRARHPARRRERRPRASSSSRREARRARAREGPARPHEGQLARDRAPARLPRLRRREALRRGRARSSASGASSASTPRPPTARGRTRSRCCGARCGSVRERSGLPPGSHDDKALVEILETLPARRALPDLRRRPLRDRHGHPPPRRAPAGPALPRAATRFGRFLSCLVFVPRDRFNTQVRERIEDDPRRRRFEGVERRLQRPPLGVGARAAPLRHPHAAGARCRSSTCREIEARLVEATRSWADDLLDALVEQLGEERGHRALRASTGTRSRPPTADDFTPAARPCSTSSAWSASTPRATWP